MTSKEAIEILKANYPDACYSQLREAVDKAIQALETQINKEDEYNKGLNDLREGYAKVVKQLSKDEFIKNNCHNCGTQRCGGPDTEWFEGCSLKDELKKEE